MEHTNHNQGTKTQDTCRLDVPLHDLENLDLQIESTHTNLPTRQQFEHWLIAILPKDKQHHDITIRIVDKEESQSLNVQYRQKDKPTNVLSFCADLPADIDIPLLGDLVICADVVASEAREQKKQWHTHWAHMVIHGTLHLLGYDHETSHEAEIMEDIEIQCMKQLGFSNPYDDDTEPSISSSLID